MSIRYTERLADIGAAAPVGPVTDSYDNAMASALNSTFGTELIEIQGHWRDVEQVERAIFQLVTWYNEERLHSALGYLLPAEYKRDWQSTPGAHPAVCLNQSRSDSTKLGAAHLGLLVAGRRAGFGPCSVHPDAPGDV
ncbi:hypothetical protein C3489_11045 [Streptomyces sp. Ru71]|uniref:integrase core domain-containing protein n=1 Tax=Streptomyces sp. Ru71 TaxID=2080746 RepID=UPI000CDD31C4|nr:integrase core domain-containing protein [Streptomyces sp. Ru71]POX55319.1 hypothetical protein C3489_11045 [Streptomyces sp. Ru71]